MDYTRRVPVVSLMLALLAACGGGNRPSGGAATETPGRPPEEPASATMDTSITPAMLALGDSIFHGQAAGGTCFTCHGPDAKGTAMCPDLTDKEWLHGDGSYPFIINTVHDGVSPPKKYPTAMPPMGGASLSAYQIRAVAAYVYSLTHKIG